MNKLDEELLAQWYQSRLQLPKMPKQIPFHSVINHNHFVLTCGKTLQFPEISKSVLGKNL